MVYRPAQVYNGSGWDDVGDKRMLTHDHSGGADGTNIPQSSVTDLTSDLAEKLPYSYGTATPSTTDSGFLWYDSNSTPAAPKFWDGAAFQALTSGKILQVVRATDSTERSTTSLSFVDANLSVTITPSKNDSALLLVSTVLYWPSTSTDAAYGSLQITDASNNAISGVEDVEVGVANFSKATGTAIALVPVNMVAYATPATTSAITYKVRHKAGSAGYTSILKNAQTTAQMYAIEVSA